MNRVIAAGTGAAALIGAALGLGLAPRPATAPLAVAASSAPQQARAVAPPPQPHAQNPAPSSGTTRQTASVHAIETAVAQARARGADDNEVYRLRTAGLSARDIAMLEERERAERAWDARIAAWQAERARVAGDPRALQALQERMFSREEQGRLGAYARSAPTLRFD